MALADARAMLPDLAVAMAEEAEELRLLERIAAWCDRFTPFVGLEPPDTPLLDATGAAHPVRRASASCSISYAQRLRSRASACAPALAGTAVAARALAHVRSGTIASPGEDAAMVAALPVDALLYEGPVTHALRRAGLKTIGQVAGRTRAELVARFGNETASVLDRALGGRRSPSRRGGPCPTTWPSTAMPIPSQAKRCWRRR